MLLTITLELTHIFSAYGRNNKTNHKRYFDFFEEAFNYIAYKGYIRMPKEDESEWMETMNAVHNSVKGGMK